MLTVAVLDELDVEAIDLDIDDDGYVYLKQGGNWICFKQTDLPYVIRALQEQADIGTEDGRRA